LNLRRGLPLDSARIHHRTATEVTEPSAVLPGELSRIFFRVSHVWGHLYILHIVLHFLVFCSLAGGCCYSYSIIVVGRGGRIRRSTTCTCSITWYLCTVSSLGGTLFFFAVNVPFMQSRSSVDRTIRVARRALQRSLSAPASAAIVQSWHENQQCKGLATCWIVLCQNWT